MLHVGINYSIDFETDFLHVQVSRDVDERQQELTHQVHREILLRCLEEVKTLTPILICSMKIFIQIHSDGKENLDHYLQKLL